MFLGRITNPLNKASMTMAIDNTYSPGPPANAVHAAAWLLVLLASSAAIAQDAAELKAFPGAEGWGAASKGGRGGRVIKVTNLNASGPGSLAEACAADGPRIIVFEVSGVIRGDVRITKPYLTLAGQTAPGAGITVEGVVSSYDYGIHDIIIRHLRVRPPREVGAGGDCIQLGGLGPTRSGTYNIILDHVSLSWGNDEMIDLYHAHDVTVQWCTIEESDDQGHSKGATTSLRIGVIRAILGIGSGTDPTVHRGGFNLITMDVS